MTASQGEPPTDYVSQNRAAWDRMAADYVHSGRRNGASDAVTSGIFDVPETEIGMHRFAWSDGAVELHIPHGQTIQLPRESGFEIEDLVEVEIPDGAATRHPFVTPDWARRWPGEEVWKARKR